LEFDGHFRRAHSQAVLPVFLKRADVGLAIHKSGSGVSPLFARLSRKSQRRDAAATLGYV